MTAGVATPATGMGALGSVADAATIISRPCNIFMPQEEPEVSATPVGLTGPAPAASASLPLAASSAAAADAPTTAPEEQVANQPEGTETDATEP